MIASNYETDTLNTILYPEDQVVIFKSEDEL